VSDARSLTRLPAIAGLFADVAGLVNGLLAGALEIHPDHDSDGATADTSPDLNLEELLGLTSPVETQL